MHGDHTEKERGGNMGTSLYCGFCGKKQVRQDKMARLSSCRGLWGVGVVPSCLVAGPGVRAGELWWQGKPTKEAVENVGSALVCLHLKDMPGIG